MSMPAESGWNALDERRAIFAPKLCYFHPLMAGPFHTWAEHLARFKDMGFDTVHWRVTPNAGA
jgi:hypothetical protein